MADGCLHQIPCDHKPEMTLILLSAEKEALFVSFAACHHSEVLKDMVGKVQPISFDYPSIILKKLIEYWEKVAARHLPNRKDADVPYFSLNDDERALMCMPLRDVGRYSAVARVMGSKDFVHVLALKCALDMSRFTKNQRKNALGINENNVGEDLRKHRRGMIGKHILSVLGIYN